MKSRFIFLLGFLFNHLAAQSVDSVAIKQVDSLIQVSLELRAKYDFDKALQVNAEAEKIALEKIGKQSVAYANVYFNQGKINYDKNDLPLAEKCYLESIAIWEKVQGKQNLDYIKRLSNLANLYRNMSYFQKSEELHLEAKAIIEKVLGKENFHYAWSLTNFANLYMDLGNYDKAEQLYIESNAITEKLFGRENPNFVMNLTNLANLHLRMGNYQKAEPLYLESIAIREKIQGKEHPNYARCLANLAILYDEIGNFEKAEPLYLESKAIREKTLGKEHPDYAQSLNGLANHYYQIGQYEKAELYHLEAKGIWEKVREREHPNYATILSNLALLYFQMGNFEKAEPLFLESKAINERTLGKEHPQYAHSLNGLGNLYNAKGNYENAEEFFLEAKGIWEKALGKEHPDYVFNLNNLAALYCFINEYEKAESLYLEISSIDKRLIVRAMHHLSEKELNNYLNQFSDRQNLNLSFTQHSNKGKILTVCYDNILFYKGFLVQAANQVKNLALSDTFATEKFNLLRSYGHRLAVEYSKPIIERIGVAELEEKANMLEKELTRMVAGYGEAMRQVNWKEVQRNLAAGEAAAEFVHYRFAGKQQSDSTMYAALLLLPGAQQPIFIPLFEEKQLDSLLKTSGERKADYVNGLYTLADRGAMAIEAPKKSLYELIWKPMEKELSGVKKIYFSPTGLLHRINLDAIPVSQMETLADKFQLIEVNSTRQLVIPNQKNIANQDAVLIGGIQYEQDSTIQNNEPILVSRSRGELSFSSIDSTLRGGSWNSLAWTEWEVSSIEKIMQTAGVAVSLKKGNAATEESFKNIGTNNSPSPRILHVATHGYFFADPKSTTKTSGFDNQIEPIFKMSNHPMLRSGLIMAGGNAAWQGKQTLKGRDDGILTAYEISQMNLSNTELVVLSACETGLGDIQGNEGVYGLQRAFKIAGAKYLIMSLWQVPDKQTSLLMITFYKKWLEEKMTIPDAFHAAQKELRDNGLDPYNWAGFVLVE